ncbi:MAG: hypothetical protein JSV36_02505 [Anaerolineae bacterium]|nr:MAG: hypothetical protein JSV36_02505 [Anaerolineae bacterium]
MDSLLFVKGLIGLAVFIAAIGALITQLQIRKKIPPVLRARPQVLRNWHLWMGRVALGGFVLNSTLCLLIGLYPAPRTDPRHLAHSILATLCVVFFLGKVWVTRRKVRWAMRRILPLGMFVFALQTAIFLTATVFALWARIVGLV